MRDIVPQLTGDNTHNTKNSVHARIPRKLPQTCRRNLVYENDNHLVEQSVHLKRIEAGNLTTWGGVLRRRISIATIVRSVLPHSISSQMGGLRRWLVRKEARPMIRGLSRNARTASSIKRMAVRCRLVHDLRI